MHVLYRMANPADGASHRSFDRALARRVGTYARPYSSKLVGFLATIVASALLGLAPPFLFREIIDEVVPSKDTGMLTVLAVLVVVAAIVSALLGLAERYWSAVIGEASSMTSARSCMTTCNAFHSGSSPAPRPVRSSAG